MNKPIEQFIAAKQIALAGASRSRDKVKFGNIVAAELRHRGYEIFLVHPLAGQIDDEVAYPNLSSLKDRVDGLLVVLPPAKSIEVLRDAAAAGVSNIWIQQGGESPEVIKIGRELNLNLVAGKCILMYAQPVRGIHALHRFIVRLGGQL